MDKVPITDNIIEQLLQAREMRLQRKLDMVANRYHLISLQLNIPGLPKRNDSLKQFIERVDEAFQLFFQSRCILNKWIEKHFLSDVAGDAVLYLFDKSGITAMDLKALTEEFESTFELGRIVDLDVLSAEGLPISSGKAKKCFVCSEVAELCRKTNKHTIDHVRTLMMAAINDDLRRIRAKELIRKVSGYAVNALLLEVSLSPKPGLVCRASSGAHSDMDYITFLNSVSVLSPYFIEIGEVALTFKGYDVSKALPIIREIGLKMEHEMKKATYGVNTHKGAIFLMAISCFALVRVVIKNGVFKANSFSSIIQQLTRGMVQRELCAINDKMEMTHGQKCFMSYSLQGAGARGEAEQGLPTVLHHALPYLNRQKKDNLFGLSDNELKVILIPVLLKIMTVNNDTNVMYRHNKQILDVLKGKAKEALRDWESGKEEKYMQLVVWCNHEKISSGGSADLLALTVMLHFVQTEFS